MRPAPPCCKPWSIRWRIMAESLAVRREKPGSVFTVPSSVLKLPNEATLQSAFMIQHPSLQEYEYP